MNRLSYEPGHLRHLAAALRSEVRLIERHNRGLKRMEHETGTFFPVEKAANDTRIENLSDAAHVLDALADQI